MPNTDFQNFLLQQQFQAVPQEQLQSTVETPVDFQQFVNQLPQQPPAPQSSLAKSLPAQSVAEAVQSQLAQQQEQQFQQPVFQQGNPIVSPRESILQQFGLLSTPPEPKFLPQLLSSTLGAIVPTVIAGIVGGREDAIKAGLTAIAGQDRARALREQQQQKAQQALITPLVANAISKTLAENPGASQDQLRQEFGNNLTELAAINARNPDIFNSNPDILQATNLGQARKLQAQDNSAENQRRTNLERLTTENAFIRGRQDQKAVEKNKTKRLKDREVIGILVPDGDGQIFIDVNEDGNFVAPNGKVFSVFDPLFVGLPLIRKK